jgi:hypothetical protein
MFPINTFLIIKEPYLDDEACNPHISVASPTDIQIVGLRDSLVANVVWKEPSHPDHVDTVKHTPVSFDLAKSEAKTLSDGDETAADLRILAGRLAFRRETLLPSGADVRSGARRSPRPWRCGSGSPASRRDTDETRTLVSSGSGRRKGNRASLGSNG